MQSDVKSYQYDHLPVIDYDKHPAYGRVLPMAQFGMRLKALVYFLYGLILASARRIVDLEHLPRPGEHDPKLTSIIRHLPTYLRLIVLQRLGRLSAGNAFKPKTERGTDLLQPLQRDGIVGVRLETGKVAEIRDLLAPHFNILEQRLALNASVAGPAVASTVTPPAVEFDASGTPAGHESVVAPPPLARRSAPAQDSRIWLDPDSYPAVYKWFNQTAADLGLLEAASAYLKRPVGVGHIAAEIVGPVGPAGQFADVAVEDPPTDGFHIDPSFNVLKFILYVSDVGADNGPLTYVTGSHRASRGFWDGLIRRANDLGGLSDTTPAARELFHALPESLRRKAAFGADLLADGDYAKAILSEPWSATSSSGNGVLYDPFGIHRDAVVRQGRRLAVVAKLTELPR